MKEIIALSKNESFIILRSLGIDVFILEDEESFKEHVKKAVLEQSKIIIYDSESSKILDEIIEKYDDNLYPIFVKLPTSITSEDSLIELKSLIEKSIGISVI